MISHIYFIKLQIPCFLMTYNNPHEFKIENFGFRFTIFGSDPRVNPVPKAQALRADCNLVLL